YMLMEILRQLPPIEESFRNLGITLTYHRTKNGPELLMDCNDILAMEFAAKHGTTARAYKEIVRQHLQDTYLEFVESKIADGTLTINHRVIFDPDENLPKVIREGLALRRYRGRTLFG